MKNIDMQVDGKILTIKIDLSKTFGSSKSGKSVLIASTEGNQSVPGPAGEDGEDIKLGLNVYKKTR